MFISFGDDCAEYFAHAFFPFVTTMPTGAPVCTLPASTRSKGPTPNASR